MASLSGRIFRLTLDDESHLRNICRFRFSWPAAVAVGAAFVIVSLFVAVLIVMLTPLHSLLPGYLSEQQRVATEENLLRLDSLRDAYSVNQRYIDNFLSALDIDRTPSDSLAAGAATTRLAPDSLLSALPTERKFVSTMEERERFNISVLAPLAADGIMFSPPSGSGIFSADSRNSETGVVLAPNDSPVQSPADGNIVATYYSQTEGGYVIVIQHGRGFLSALYRVGQPLVGIGDAVNSGQAIALAPAPDRTGARRFSIRLWHNSLPLIPYEYVGKPMPQDFPDTPYDAPRGR